MPKLKPGQEHMPLLQLSQPGKVYSRDDDHVECDYCDADATWYHFADRTGVNRDACACDTHVGLLNRHYGTDNERR